MKTTTADIGLGLSVVATALWSGLVLAASEAAANVVEHARRSDPLRTSA